MHLFMPRKVSKAYDIFSSYDSQQKIVLHSGVSWRGFRSIYVELGIKKT